MRRTLKSAVKFRGIGVHGGQPVMLTVAPASAGTGIMFRRTDAGPAARPIAARYDCVVDTRLCTRLGNGDGLTVATVEHLMAALAGCGITDAQINLDGPEVPILDGSAAGFVTGFVGVGFRDLGEPCRAIRILEPVTVERGDRVVTLAPAPRFEMDVQLSFADSAVGVQSLRLALTGNAVAAELSDARTFGFLADVETLRRAGLGRGASLDNAIVVDGGRVLNPDGLRRPDEFVRHKMLDAVGDLALAGAPIIGRYTGVKPGHELTNALLHALFERPDAWTWCDLAPGQAPGGAISAPALAKPATPVAV